MGVHGYKIGVNSMSDHYPLIFKIQTVKAEIAAHTRWNVRLFLDQQVKEDYQETIFEYCQAIPEDFDHQHVQDQWNLLKEAIEEAAKVTVGQYTYSKNLIKSVENDYTRQLLEELHDIEAKLRNIPDTKHAYWKILNIQKSKTVKAYKETHQRLVTAQFQKTICDLSKQQNKQALIKKLSCKINSKMNATKSLDPKKMKDHVKHFQTTFGKIPMTPQTYPKTTEVSDTTFTEEDVQLAIDKTSLGKAAGSDGLFAEFFHYGSKSIVPWLMKMFNNIIQQQDIPADWKNTLICPIYKKGDHTVAANYRPIAITSACRRIYEKCVFNRLISEHTHKLADTQCGRNCQQHIFTLHEALISKPCHSVFLDQAAAYDSVNRNLLWIKLRDQFQIPETTIDILKVLFDDNKSILVIKNHKSDQIPNTCGLLQGSALSPILFNLFNDDLLRALASSQGVKVYGVKITNLAFADDIAIVAETEAEIQKMTRIAEEWANNNEMIFNVNKCAYLGSANNGPEMNNGLIPKQQRTKYLGMIFNAQGLDTIASAGERANYL
jgi:hypothetical protein